MEVGNLILNPIHAWYPGNVYHEKIFRQEETQAVEEVRPETHGTTHNMGKWDALLLGGFIGAVLAFLVVGMIVIPRD